MKKNSNNLILKTLFCIFLLIFSATVITSNAYNIKNKLSEKKYLTKRLEKLKEDEKTLSDDVEKLKNPEYAARYAREKYLYSKTGEKILKVN